MEDEIITKMESLEPGSDVRVLMETLFKMAARDLLPTIGAEAGQNEKELRKSLIDLWDHDVIRWVTKEVKSDSEPCFFLEMMQPNGNWEPITFPQIH